MGEVSSGTKEISAMLVGVSCTDQDSDKGLDILLHSDESPDMRVYEVYMDSVRRRSDERKQV
jgi:hypothetical protein